MRLRRTGIAAWRRGGVSRYKACSSRRAAASGALMYPLSPSTTRSSCPPSSSGARVTSWAEAGASTYSRITPPKVTSRCSLSPKRVCFLRITPHPPPRYEMHTHHGHGQRIHHTLPIMGRGDGVEHAAP